MFNIINVNLVVIIKANLMYAFENIFLKNTFTIGVFFYLDEECPEKLSNLDTST